MNTNAKKKGALLLAVLLLLSLFASAYAESAVDILLSSGTTQAFTDDPVDESDLNTILQAGLHTTSAINQQPWYFVTLTDSEVMAELSAGGGMPAGFPSGGGKPTADGVGTESAESGELPFNPPSAPEGMQMPEGVPPMGSSSSPKASLGDSPLAILVYMNETTASPNASFDCGLACQSMVIAANALGYGTKIISSPTMSLNGDRHDEFCELLGVDPAYSAIAVILVGRTNDGIDGATGASVRDDLAAKVSFVQ